MKRTAKSQEDSLRDSRRFERIANSPYVTVEDVVPEVSADNGIVLTVRIRNDGKTPALGLHSTADIWSGTPPISFPVLDEKLAKGSRDLGPSAQTLLAGKKLPLGLVEEKG